MIFLSTNFTDFTDFLLRMGGFLPMGGIDIIILY